MYCGQCGNQIPEDVSFCSKCGASVGIKGEKTIKAGTIGEMPQMGNGKMGTDLGKILPPEAKDGKKFGKKGIIAICTAVAVLAIGVGSILYFTSDDYHCKKYLKLAGQCYESAEYEEALEYCVSVLELDDTVAEAYRLISDIYLAQDKCVEAVQALMDGRETVEADEAAELEEREAYLRENIVVVRQEGVVVRGVDNLSYEIEYDEQGNCIKEVVYGEDDKIELWYEHEYDERNNEIKKTVCFQYGLEMYYYVVFEYDERDNQTKKITYYADGSIGWSNSGYWLGSEHWLESEYDERNNQTKRISYNADGNISGWAEYEYTERDRQAKEISYNADGSISSWVEYEYDERDNPIKRISYQPDGSVNGWAEYEYDENDDQINVVSYTDGKINFWRESEYDERGNQTKLEYTVIGTDGNQSHYIYVWEYDVLDNELSRSSINGENMGYSARRDLCMYDSVNHSFINDTLPGYYNYMTNKFAYPHTTTYQYHYIGD